MKQPQVMMKMVWLVLLKEFVGKDELDVFRGWNDMKYFLFDKHVALNKGCTNEEKLFRQKGRGKYETKYI